MPLSRDCRLWYIDNSKYSKPATLDETWGTGDVDKKSPFYYLEETAILKLICYAFSFWLLILFSMHN